MTDLIPFPGFEELKNEIEQLRTELSMLVLERDDLRLVVCKDLETIYLLHFGALEYRLYKTQCEYLRLKRKAELIQAHINRQERIDLERIGHKLDAEFAEYQQKLDERIEQMNAALEHGKSAWISAAEANQLKKMYRKIVKALHPDLHPELTDAQKQLFLNAVEAYEKGDATSLEVIAAMVADAGAFVAPDAPDARTAMLKEKKRLA
ncbi:MAG: molecular chaperone DnaJ, partial [Deltaproteobacteria bacterium]|nr:molecular chaperone DnaJ [Deltaproteobacteria bacterium]